MVHFLIHLLLLCSVLTTTYTILRKTTINQSIRDWEKYKAMHSKDFANRSQEGFEHFLSFLSAQHKAQQHNEAYRRGELSFRLNAWNALADLPFSEYMKLNGYRQSDGARSSSKNASLFLLPLNAWEMPGSIDWRDHGYVTAVENQGLCGSCWSFSATGSLEGQHKRATGLLVALSKQNLIDCSSKYGTRGCHGGWVDSAFEYIKENHGIDVDFYYPYAEEEQRCMYNDQVIGATVTGYVDIVKGDENALKVAVATQGPISVIIDAGHQSFALYKAGVYDEKECSSERLNHAVLVVGYGTHPVHGDYWIVKNSWGNRWGEDGYIRMSRNNNNQCGIATKASYPLV